MNTHRLSKIALTVFAIFCILIGVFEEEVVLYFIGIGFMIIRFRFDWLMGKGERR